MMNLNTPIEKIRLPDSEEYGVDVFIKRDDLIHPFISGNKWRKLSLYVEDIREKQATMVVSFGGAWSNHLVALANAGACFGFKTYAFVRGEEVSNPMLTICKMFGMQLHFVSRERYRHKEELVRDTFPMSENQYIIDEGGRGMLGVNGFGSMLSDVDQYTHLICAVGTGTTLAGLTKAYAKAGLKVEGIGVLKGSAGIAKEVRSFSGVDVLIHEGYEFGGYGKWNEELIRFIQHVASGSGILFDQIYTGKMVYAVNDMIKKGVYKKGDRLLLVHTGGLLGMSSLLNL